MSGVKIGKSRRILSILRYLITKGARSYPELRKRFPNFGETNLHRDIKLLKETGLVVERVQSRNVNGTLARKVFMYFKDNRDVVGETRRGMERLKGEGYAQVTLDMIASYAGFPPNEIKVAAYSLASKLNLMIGRESRVAPSEPLMAGC